jgi:TonB-dependent SusC/RagA subfamily outer membrane receptor
MKQILLYTCLLVTGIPAISQEKYNFVPARQPFVMIDTFVTELKSLVISPDKIESVNVLKDSNAIANYGDKARYGAIIIKTKPDTKLLRINEVLDLYKITGNDRKLRVCINNSLVQHPELLLVAASEILGVEITTEKNWIDPKEANSTEKLINIRIPAAQHSN